MSENLEVRGCVLPLDLHYDVSENTWVRLHEDGTATVGMTDVAQNLAGELLHAKPKKVGALRKRGKPVATVESSKWVGPVKSPITGEVIEVNEELSTDATVVNRSPYKNGWIVRMQPTNLEEELQSLLTGQPAVDAYRERIEKEDIKACEHVDGFEI